MAGKNAAVAADLSAVETALEETPVRVARKSASTTPAHPPIAPGQQAETTAETVTEEHPILEAETADRVAEARPELDRRSVEEPMPTKRRMPDNLRRFLLKMQGGKQYLPAAYRIVWFRDECPDWGVETTLIEGGQEAGFATVHARIYNAEGRLVSSGMKTETKMDFPAGWVEKAESGAISRALAVAGFGTQFMPELDDDGSRPADSPLTIVSHSPSPSSFSGYGVRADSRPTEEREARPAMVAAAPASAVWEGPGQCPTCHAPEGRRHGKLCLG